MVVIEGELNDHVGYSRHDPAGRYGGNSRNGYRAKTVITEAGPDRHLGAAGLGFQVRAENRRQGNGGSLESTTSRQYHWPQTAVWVLCSARLSRPCHARVTPRATRWLGSKP